MADSLQRQKREPLRWVKSKFGPHRHDRASAQNSSATLQAHSIEGISLSARQSRETQRPSYTSISSNAAAATPLIWSTAAPSFTENHALQDSSPNSQDNRNAASLPDLWSDASENLDEEDRATIGSIRSSIDDGGLISDRINEMIRMTRKAQERCESRASKFKIRGKEIDIRKVTGQIINFLTKFKEVGDIAVNFDPVHAALPWAGVRFLLQAAIGEHEQMGDLLDCIETVSYLTDRCTIYEILYNPQTTNGQALVNLQKALVSLYTAILQLIARSYRMFADSTIARAWHAAFNLDEFSNLNDLCKTRELEVEIAVHNCERKRSKEADDRMQKIMEISQDLIAQTNSGIAHLMEVVDARERLEILDWISRVPYGKHHDAVAVERTTGTCEWLLEHERFREWRNSQSSVFLWLHGTAGTGKSVLVSKVIDTIRLSLQRSQHGFAFFYCKRDENERREPLSVLCGLVRQLSIFPGQSQSIKRNMRQRYLEMREKASTLTIENCQDLLLEFVNQHSITIIVLDALDECERHKRNLLIKTLDSLVAKASNPVKIFISSRPDNDIKERFRSVTNVEIQAQDNENDISKYIASAIVEHERWAKMSSRLREDVISTLQSQSHGMFQWAYMQISQLLRLPQERLIRERLGKLPTDLRNTYDEIYELMEDHEREIADRAFQWVMAAAAPLSTTCLLEAVCQDENEDDIKGVADLDEDLLLEYCHHLLVIDKARQVWIPSHLSVIEYLENHRFTMFRANRLVSCVCILKIIDSAKAAIIQPGEPSLEHYAYHHWPLHVRFCDRIAGNDLRLKQILAEFFGSLENSSIAYRNWHAALAETDSKRQIPASSAFGDSTYFKTVSLRELIPNRASIWAVCAFGLYELVSEWCSTTSIDVSQRNANNGTLLYLAATSGSVSICKRLRALGAEVNETIDHRLCSFETALQVAAGVHQEQTSLFLVTAGADPNQITDGNYGCALNAAIHSGSVNIVKLLIKNGANVNLQIPKKGFQTPLYWALEDPRPICSEITRILLESKADANIQVEYVYGSPLCLAASAYAKGIDAVAWQVSHHTIFDESRSRILLLLDYGADVDMQVENGDFGSALCAAGTVANAQLLLDHGADTKMEVKHGKYGNALCGVAMSGLMPVVELLLDLGADVNEQVRNGCYGSALCAAAASKRPRECKQSLIKLLLDRGADVNMQLEYGNFGSALCAADRPDETTEFLLEHGAEVNMQLMYGPYGSALCTAVYRAASILELLQGGADINMQVDTGEYGSALCVAVVNKYSEICEFLINEGADVNLILENRPYKNALGAAIRERDTPAAVEQWEREARSEIVDILKKHGAKLVEDVVKDEKIFDRSTETDGNMNHLMPELTREMEHMQGEDDLRIMEA